MAQATLPLRRAVEVPRVHLALSVALGVTLVKGTPDAPCGTAGQGGEHLQHSDSTRRCPGQAVTVSSSLLPKRTLGSLPGSLPFPASENRDPVDALFCLGWSLQASWKGPG